MVERMASPESVIVDWEALDAATRGLDAPFAVADPDAFDAHAGDLQRRAGAVPLRLASQSLRVRAGQGRALAAGFRGVPCFTVAEGLRLAELGCDDLVAGHPTVDRAAMRQLGRDGGRLTVMVDSLQHLDPLERGGGSGHRAGRVTSSRLDGST